MMSTTPTEHNEGDQPFVQPKHCTCLFTKPGTFDARAAAGFEYTTRPPSIRDPFCTYQHVKEEAA